MLAGSSGSSPLSFANLRIEMTGICYTFGGICSAPSLPTYVVRPDATPMALQILSFLRPQSEIVQTSAFTKRMLTFPLSWLWAELALADSPFFNG